MVVSVPPMIMGLTVASSEEPSVPALNDDFAGVFPAVSSPARAPETRCSSSVSGTELVAGFTAGFGSAPAAPADELSRAAATAAATPAAATGSPIRIRRL